MLRVRAAFPNVELVNITDEFDLIKALKSPEEMVLVREAARIHDSVFSASLKPFWDIKIVYYFDRRDFHPPPKVDVVMLHFKMKVTPDIPKNKQSAFADFLHKGFRYGITSLMPKRQVNNTLKRAGLKQIGESETMLYVQWLCLFRCGLK